MALYPNGRKLQVYTQRPLGGSAMAYSPYFINRNERACRYFGETWSRGGGGIPTTGFAPGAPLLPMTYTGAGALTTGAAATSTFTATAIVSSVGNMAMTASAVGAFAATLTGTGDMAMTVLPYTTGTAEDYANVFWNWVSEAGQSYGKQFRDMRAVLLGRTSGGGSALEVFYAVDGITPRVSSANNGSDRTTVSTPGT